MPRKETLEAVRTAYQAVFIAEDGKPSPMAEVVLRDLFAFCHVHRPPVMVAKTGMVDPHASMVAAGRQEVGLRMVEMLHLSADYVTNTRRQVYDDRDE